MFKIEKMTNCQRNTLMRALEHYRNEICDKIKSSAMEDTNEAAIAQLFYALEVMRKIESIEKE